MAKYNSENERIKRKYFSYLHNAKGRSIKTVDGAVKAIVRYEEFTGFSSFKKFTSESAIEFKKFLLKSNNAKGELLSVSTIHHTLKPLKDFLEWLAQQQGYKCITFTDTQYLNLTNKDKRKTQSLKYKTYPSFEQVRKVLAFNPKNEIEMRDRAIVAFLACTAVRDGALVGLKLRHVDIMNKVIIQDPNQVETKNSKWINTKFFPVGADLHQIVIDWVKYLREELLFSDSDPLFPKSLIELDANHNFKSDKLSKGHWKSASAARVIIKRLFNNAGLDYYPPHRFRDMLSALGREICKTPEQMIAWGRNYGHENWATTFISYGGFTPQMQMEVLSKMENRAANSKTGDEDMIAKFQAFLASNAQ